MRKISAKLAGLPLNERLKYDLEAFESSAPLFITKAWNLLEEVGAKESLSKGTTIKQLMAEKNIKNKKMLECVLGSLVTGGVLKFENQQYSLLNLPKPPTKKQMNFLRKYYSNSLEWVEFVTSKAKETLLEGKAPVETGFEHNKGLELWDLIMEESPYSSRIIAVKKFSDNLKEGSCVLDYGCGGGIGLEAVLKNVNKEIELTGAEISKEYLERAKIRIKKLYSETTDKIIRDNINKMQFIQFNPERGLPTDKKYDVIFISIVLNHIAPEERDDFFENIKGMLKDDGIFVVYQLIHQSKLIRNPICWTMHTVPTHTEYPFREEYIEKLKKHFKNVEESLKGMVVVTKNY